MKERDVIAAEARGKAERDLEELCSFLAFPTVSALPEHKEDLLRAADWLKRWLASAGADECAFLKAGEIPLVYAEWKGPDEAPSLLVYGHYDVQPVDPLEEWKTPPFEGVVRGDNLYARGASDMKGQVYAFVKAAQTLCLRGRVPLTVKLILDGEEESLSPHLREALEAEKERLRCQWVLNCDSGALGPRQPAVTCALRGIAYYEIELTGGKTDLHSGSFGGAVVNPANLLCRLVAGMHDEEGRVVLPGFYDRVRPLSPETQEELSRIPMEESAFRRIAGSAPLGGEAGYTTLERLGVRPSLDVNGLKAGYTKAGVKTVLPNRAMAKLSFRLVPDQDPSEIEGQLREYLERRVPEGISWTLRELMRGPWALADKESLPARTAFNALREAFGVSPLFRRQGFSVPAVGHIKELYGVDAIMMGFMLPDDGIHGPNERQHLPTLYKGTEAYLRFLTGLADAWKHGESA